MTTMDDLDRQIIELLQKNGSLTNAEIADFVDTSEATVRRRRLRLQDEDIIRNIAAINPFVLGYRVIVVMGLQVKTGMLNEVETILSNTSEVRFLGVTFGRYDLVLEAWFKSSEDLINFINITLAETQGVQRAETFQVVRLSKYSEDWMPRADANQILIEDTEERDIS